MSLIRFGQSDGRGPTAELWQGVADWVKGTTDFQFGTQDFNDFSPYLGTDVGYAAAGTTGAAVSERAEANGVVRITADAGTNAEVGLVFNKVIILGDSDILVMETKFLQTAGAASDHILAYGLTDQTGGAILASNALAVSSNQDFIGLRWNTDTSDGGEIDLVLIEDGSATVLYDNVFAEDIDRGTSMKLGLRFQKIESGKFRILASKDGVISRAAITVVEGAAVNNLLAATLKPAIAIGAGANTTAPIADIDWNCVRDIRRS